VNMTQEIPSVSFGHAVAEDRLHLLKEVFSAALATAHGAPNLSEQQVSQLMSGLVKARLLTADDSYRLQDRILDRAVLDRAIDMRIEGGLRAKGVITQSALNALKARIARLES